MKKGRKVVRVEKRDGRKLMFDPLAGAELGPAKRKTKKITINNKLRRVIRSALGSLTLLSPSADVRRAAAQAVFRSPRADSLPLMEKALAKEIDDAVAHEMRRAIAALRLTAGEDLDVRLAGAHALGDFPDPQVRDLLARIANDEATPAALKTASEEGLAALKRRLELLSQVQNLFQGISLGSVLLLAAIALAITFGIIRVINMAHGEMVMLGAYTTFVVQQLFREHLPARDAYSLAVAIPAAFLVGGLFGVAIERGIIRWLYGRPLETLLATWGLSLILQQLVRTLFGPTNREVANPEWMSGALEITGSLAFTWNRIWIIVFALAVILALTALMHWTRFDLDMRAVTQNRRMAGAVGIRSGMVNALTFGLGSGIAGMAGVALSQIDNVSPNLGQGYIIDSFLVVVFGGVGHLWGTLVGALSLGVASKFLEAWAGAVLAKILILVAVILFIRKRPRGLFALKGRAVES